MSNLIPALVALALAAGLTPLIIHLAHRHELVARPSEDRWHKRPTALFGGVAVFISFAVPALLLVQYRNSALRLAIAGLLIGSTLMFLLGLVDDLVHLKPSTKIIGQIVAACILVYCGGSFAIIDWPLITIPLTIFWVVGITNAFNLLDNMDGLAAGIGAICCGVIFALNQYLDVRQGIGTLALIFCASLVGFLFYNFNPARIFMGDCGSMMIGFTLAGLTIVGSWHQASNVFLILVLPVLILGVPIFDTAFVTATRRLRGQSVSVGGRDHTSHRLVALGLSERQAVLILYSICMTFGSIAVLSLKFDAFIIGTLLILVSIVILIFGMFLGQSRLYRNVGSGPEAAARSRAGRFVFGTFVRHKRRAVEVLIDLALFGAALVSAFLIRFDGRLSSGQERLLILALPVIIPIKLLTFWAFGLYRRLWNFMGADDLVTIFRAVLTSSLISVMTLWGLTRLEGYSRTVFLLDGILLLLFAAGSRILFRVFQETLAGEPMDGKRLLIFGAGQAGELVLRELRRQPELGYRPVGFVDDDPEKWGRGIHGVRIFGGRDQLGVLSRTDSFDEIVIAIPSLSMEDRSTVLEICQATGRVTRVMEQVSRTFLN